MTADETSTLATTEIATLRRMIARTSVVRTAKMCRVSRHTLERGLAGLGIRHGSAVLVRLALATKQEVRP
jgi:hypothetical protein